MRYDQGFESTPPQFRPGQHLVITNHHIDQQETSQADAACVFAVLNCPEQNILARAFRGELVLQDKAELPHPLMAQPRDPLGGVVSGRSHRLLACRTLRAYTPPSPETASRGRGRLLTDSPPYDPRAVANLLLDVARDDGIAISNLALQKLLYFAHGHFLIQTGQPLASGAFEAWNNGPVHPAVYHAFKASGRDPIRDRAVGRNVMTGETRVLALPDTPDVRRHLRRVIDAYGHLSPGLLVAISHAPNGPWATIRDRATHATALGARIPDSLTKERFRFQKISVGVGVVSDTLADDAPLAPGNTTTHTGIV